MEGVTQKLADFSSGITFEDLPDRVVHESKRLLLDSIGCAIAGLVSDKGKSSVKLARRMGGPGESTILGSGDRVSCCAAAFANGELINALDYDTLTPPSHISPYVIPAGLALAETVRAPGREVILAVALAHELSSRLAFSMTLARVYTAEGTGIKRSPVHGYSGNVFGGTARAALSGRSGTP